MFPAVGTPPDTSGSATQQGDVGLINNIKSRVKGRLSSTACPE